MVNYRRLVRHGWVIKGRQDPALALDKGISLTFRQSLEQPEKKLEAWIFMVGKPI